MAKKPCARQNYAFSPEHASPRCIQPVCATTDKIVNSVSPAKTPEPAHADDLPANWREDDALGSFHEAIGELRRRHLVGEPAPMTGYFARSEVRP